MTTTLLPAPTHQVPVNTVRVHSSVEHGRPVHTAECTCGVRSRGYREIGYAHDWSDGHRGLIAYGDIPLCPNAGAS